MQKNIFIIIIIIALGALAIGAAVVGFFTSNQIFNTIKDSPYDGVGGSSGSEAEGIKITLPQKNATVTSPLKITGTVYGNGWVGFEGQVGTVRLLDGQGNQLALGILTASGDWMKLPTNFETTLWYSYAGTGSGTLVFHNENASGEPSRNKTFTMPVKLITTSGDKTTVKVYFTSSQDNSCQAILESTRNVPQTSAVARASLDELLKGPNDQEKAAGFTTSINQGVTIQSLTIQNGVAKVDFNNKLDEGVAGSCRVTAIRSQIEKTLKQFSTISSVQISVNGIIDTILQP